MNDATRHLWAKAARSSTEFHPLVCHLLDVAATAEALLQGCVPQCVRQRLHHIGNDSSLAAWCGLHDLGKASPAFQSKRADLAHAIERHGLKVGASRVDARGGPHGLVTLWTLPALLETWAADPRAAQDLSRILGAHHGFFPSHVQGRARRDLAGMGLWDECRADLLAVTLKALGAQVPNRHLPAAESILLAGLCSVADWIGSNTEWFPYCPDDGEDGDRYLIDARARAAAALGALRWVPWRPSTASFATLFRIAPRPLQVEVEKLVRKAAGPGVLIVEAPMGEGKTEAALLTARYLAARSGYGGFYFALPTQATSNQMLERLISHLTRASDAETINLQLLHGAAWLNPTVAQLGAETASAIQGIGDQDEDLSRVVVAEWFTHAKRGLLAPFGVGTVDQILLAGMRTRHVFVRLFGLAGKVVIIDEVHAYDTYMSTILDRTIAWLAALGSSVVLLSATLPRQRREALIEAWARGAGQVRSDPKNVADAAYPVITWVGPDGVHRRHPQSWVSRTVSLVQHRWDSSTNDGRAHLANAVVGAVADGGCVAVICNTVATAQAVFAAVRERADADVWTGLAHSRFCAEDRARWEGEILQRFGPPARGERPAKAVLIATQVVEQSLDVDFDLLISELAPIDLMLQRIGRLHRHSRIRPAPHHTPSCWWFGPPEDERGIPRFRGWRSSSVYAPHLLLRSWLLACSRTAVAIPQDVADLVETMYGGPELWPSIPEAVQGLWNETAAELARSRSAMQLEAKARFLPPPDPDLDLADISRDPSEEDDDAHPRIQALTRLGVTMTVVCLWQVQGQTCRYRDGSDPVDLQTGPSSGEAQRLLGRSVPISISPARHPLVDVLETPPGWRGSPWLRRARALVLDPTAPVDRGGWKVSYDDQLGLLLER